jgi:hypothetical protein
LTPFGVGGEINPGCLCKLTPAVIVCGFEQQKIFFNSVTSEPRYQELVGAPFGVDLPLMAALSFFLQLLTAFLFITTLRALFGR